MEVFVVLVAMTIMMAMIAEIAAAAPVVAWKEVLMMSLTVSMFRLWVCLEHPLKRKKPTDRPHIS